MNIDRVARLSQRMATVTLWLIAVVLLLNIARWVYQPLNHSGFWFGLSAWSVSGIDITGFPWWQRAGGIVLTGVPLLALINALQHLRLLFRTYATRDYFSVSAARHLGRSGGAICIWVVLSVVCDPLISLWATMREPAGQRLIFMGAGMAHVVALFTAVCILVIACILKHASELDAEHRQII